MLIQIPSKRCRQRVFPLTFVDRFDLLSQIAKGLLRLSVGLEDVDALWADLSAALERA